MGKRTGRKKTYRKRRAKRTQGGNWLKKNVSSAVEKVFYGDGKQVIKGIIQGLDELVARPAKTALEGEITFVEMGLQLKGTVRNRSDASIKAAAGKTKETIEVALKKLNIFFHSFVIRRLTEIQGASDEKVEPMLQFWNNNHIKNNFGEAIVSEPLDIDDIKTLSENNQELQAKNKQLTEELEALRSAAQQITDESDLTTTTSAP